MMCLAESDRHEANIRKIITNVLVSAFVFCIPLTGFSAEFGIASWYGEKFHGRRTSSGEVYDMHKLTCAHRSIPFGTILLVTNLDNEKTVFVKVNDRGPFVRGRIIDLSKAAAIEIGLLKTGTARVKIEIVGKNTEIGAGARFVIQVASFRDEANAHKLKERLETSGFTCDYEKPADGVIRVVIQDVELSRLPSVLKELENMGISVPLIRKK